MSAYNIVLALHNIMRWVVVIGGVLAAVRALYGWLSSRPWRQLDNQLGLIFTVSLDIQVLLGLLLYFVLSPITSGNLSNMGELMSDAGARFYLVEHSLIMLVALVLAHVGRALSRRAEDDRGKHMRAAIFFTLAILLVLALIPWNRPLLPG
jgi:hypothetical protein